MINILNKKESLINESFFDKYIIKYKNEFKDFFISLKKQIKYNSNFRRIMLNYVKTKNIEKSDQLILKTIITDTLKMVGLGSIVIPIPGGVLLVTLLIKISKKFNIQLLPSQFEKEKEKEL